MAQLTRNSYFKNLLADEVYNGEPHKIDGDYNTLKVSVQTDVSGTLSIFQSIDGLLYQTYNDIFAISDTTHKQVHIKGRYVYLKYENGANPTTNFAIYSVLSKTTAETVSVGLQEVLVTNDYLDVSGTINVNGLLFDSSGNLRVSGGAISNQVSDPSSHQLLEDLSANITLNTDRLLYDLDIIANNGADASANALAILSSIQTQTTDLSNALTSVVNGLHDISGAVSISNQIAGFATSAKQDSILSDLDNIYLRLHDVCGNIAINNFPSLQHTYDSSANSELISIKDILADTLLTVNYGLLNDTPTQYAPVRVDTSGALLVKVNNQQSNTFDISGASFIDNKLNVYDPSSELLLTGIKTQTDKLSFQNEGTYETLRVRVENPASSVIDISGVSLVDGKLPVYDASANEPLAKLSFYADGYGAYDLRTQITNSVGVSVNNQPTFSLAAASVIGIDTLANTVQLSSGTEVALSSGSQVALSAGSQVQLTNSEVSLTSGSQIYANLRDNNGNPISSTLTELGERAINSMAFAWDNANDTYERVRLGESGGLLVETIGGVPLEVSGNLTVADISVNVLNSSLDVRCYASSNGSTWHHLASDSNGQLNVHSKLQDGAGNDLTSTLDGSVRSLDVSVKNVSVPVSNTTATALYTRVDGSGVQIANNVGSVTGPTQIGSSVDMDEYTWVGAMVNFGTISTSGSVYMEFSPDNSTWGRSFDSAFPSMGTNITSFIRPSVPNTFRYVRLYADAPLSASNVSAWISMK